MSNENRETLNNVVCAFVTTIKSLYSLAPAVVFVGVLLFWLLINASFQLSDTVMMGIVVLVIIFTSLLISLKFHLYGEAIFGLIAGLLTAFTVSWNTNRFILFLIAWFVFFGIIILLWSIKLAADLQQIIRQAAIWLDSPDINEKENQLNTIIKNSSLQMMDKLKTAKAVRLLVFRKLPLEIIEETLKSIEMFSTVTEIDHIEITKFYADLYRILDPSQKSSFLIQIDLIFDALRSIPASPEDFLKSFKNSCLLIRSHRLSIDSYLKMLETGFENGVAPDQIYEYLKSELENDKKL